MGYKIILSILMVNICIAQKTVETIEFVDIDGRESKSYLFIPEGCTAETPCPGWQINPDWTGIDDYELTRACMIADWGYVVHVPDVYGVDPDYEFIGTPVYPHLHEIDPEAYNGLLYHVLEGRGTYMQKIANGAELLRSRPEVIAEKTVANGYCFGGVGVMDALHEQVPFQAGFANHGNIFTYDTGVDEGQKPSGRVVSLSGGEDFADDYWYPPELTAGIGTGAIDWWNSLERESADWQQVRYGSGIGHFFTNFDYETDPDASDPDGPNHYDEVADIRSWDLQRLVAQTVFEEIEPEMITFTSILENEKYQSHVFDITAYDGSGFTGHGLFDSTACTMDSKCPAVVILPDTADFQADFILNKMAKIASSGYLVLNADILADTMQVADDGALEHFTRKVEDAVQFMSDNKQQWNGKLILLGYGDGATVVVSCLIHGSLNPEGIVAFGGDYYLLDGEFREDNAKTKLVIHHGYKDKFEMNDFPALEIKLEQASSVYEIDFYGSHVGAGFYDPTNIPCSASNEEASGSEDYVCFDSQAEYYSSAQTMLFLDEVFNDRKPDLGPDSECPGIDIIPNPIAADEDGDDVVTQTEYEALLAQIEANQAALDDMSSSALGAAMDIAQWQEDVESCASDILADDDDMRRQLLSHEQEEYDALEAENAKLRAAIKQEFLTKYS